MPDKGTYTKVAVTYGRLVNTGNYSSMRLEFTAERTVGEGENAKSLLSGLTNDLRLECNNKIKEILDNE